MLKGLGQLGDMAKLMKQAQDMQSKMTDIQKQLEELEVEGESGGGRGPEVARGSSTPHQVADQRKILTLQETSDCFTLAVLFHI